MGAMRRDLERRLRAVEVARPGGVEIWVDQGDGTVRGPHGEADYARRAEH
jgi:hypothetical protein